jgi:site-specific DNA-cytosine methylase
MNILSLFDGMSCGQIAINKLGIKYNNYFAAEIDKHAIQVTQANYPKTKQLGDVQFITGQQFDAIGGIDLLIGGSPCQGFSFAGKQLNFDDPRSALFFEFVRLLKECKPKYFLLENVKMKKEYQDVISKYLGVEPIQINSALVSAQNRVRLYWTNIPGVEQPDDKGILLKDIIEDGYVNKNKSWCMLESWNRFPKTTESAIGRFKRSMMPIVFSTENCDFYEGWRELKIGECEKLQTVPVGYLSSVGEKIGKCILGNGWTVDVIAHILKGIK